MPAKLKISTAEIWTAAATLGTLTGTASDAHLETAPRLDLERDEAVLSGMAHLSPSQARATLNLLASFSCRKKNTPRAK